GMLHHWEQLEVCVAQLFGVRNELIPQLFVSEPAIVVLRNAAPRAEVHFVDGDRRLVPVGRGSLRHPPGILPPMMIKGSDDRPGLRTKFGSESVWIGLERKQVAGSVEQFVLIDGAFG